MGLSLLSPLALGIAALVALPILAHMARQTPRERRAFGAMLLLERVVKRLRRRRRIKDPWLLALRVLALLLLALAVAAPVLSYRDQTPEFGGSGRVVLVIDRSASMSMADRGSTLFARARADAVAVANSLPEGTLLGAVVFDGEAIRLTPALTPDASSVATRIGDLSVSGGTSNLRAALVEARGLLGGEPGEILLFSDEAGPRIVTDAHSELERIVQGGSAVIPRTVAPEMRRNVAVVSAAYGSGIEGGTVVIRLANFGPEPREVPCEVTLPDGARVPVFVDLPPEGEAEERITVPPEALGGVGRVHCEDPDLPLDDDRYFHLPRVGASRILVVDGDPGDTPLRSEVYFFERALAPWGTAQTGFRPDVTTPGGLSTLDTETYRVVVLANVGDPRPIGPRLTEFVRKGGSLVIAAGDNVTAERYNAAFASILPSALRRSQALADVAEEGVPLALPDTRHEMFAPFARSGRAGFSRVRSHRVMTLEPYAESDDVRTLIRYEGGVPALVERTVGTGHVVFWTSTLDLGWTNLPLQAVFMPFVQRMVTVLGGDTSGGSARIDAIVGETVAVPLPDLAAEPDILGPGGDPVRSRLDGSRVVFEPETAGAYQVVLPGAPPLAWVAVNTDPIESDVRAYHTVEEAETELDPELFRAELELGSGLLGGSAVLILLQSLLMLRRRPT
ncbi:MAG: VWA domain-containing protein [Deltaproteobacteria bacterium]|nr:MAG: VWA domain-containing protein [Deltaproteobacteria bacterium]